MTLPTIFVYHMPRLLSMRRGFDLYAHSCNIRTSCWFHDSAQALRRRRAVRAPARRVPYKKYAHMRHVAQMTKYMQKTTRCFCQIAKKNSKPFIFWVYMRITHRAAVTERPFGDRRRSWTIVRWGGDSSVVSVNTRLRSRMHGKCTAGARHTSQHAATLARLHLKRVARGPGTRP